MTKRIGLLLLVLGLAGFLFAQSRRASYDSVEGAVKTTFSSDERGKKELYETGRWVALGAAVVGVVLLILPARRG